MAEETTTRTLRRRMAQTGQLAEAASTINQMAAAAAVQASMTGVVLQAADLEALAAHPRSVSCDREPV